MTTNTPRGLPFAFAAFFCAALAGGEAQGQSVLTGSYDLARTNANLNEVILNPGSVSHAQFGKLFSLPVDGQIYAQPLYQQGVTINGRGVHNVAFVATEHNSVYAFNADAAAPPFWTVNLGPSVPSTSYDTADGPYTDIFPEIGITGTPVIDASTNTLYVVAATLENGAYYYKLHALDIGSGAERFGAPSTIRGAVKGDGVSGENGTVSFDPLQHIQRPALLFLNGVVYVAFGSHGDGYPWHGWMMAYSAANVQRQTAVFNPTANGIGGAIWQSGRGPAVDDQGNIFIVTSNGESDDVTDFSDSVLNLTPELTIKDWFAPSNEQVLDATDDDLGSIGAILIPGTSLLVTGGKQGLVYVLDTAALGHISSNNEQIPQSFATASAGLFNMAVWARSTGPVMYLQAWSSAVTAYALSGTQFNTTPTSQSSSAWPRAFDGLTISASGGQPGSGILWVTTPDADALPSSGTLHAFNADDLSSELWSSAENADTDALGTFSKFANPTVVNGKVYVPTLSNSLVVYGILSTTGGGPSPVITGLANAASYANGPVAPGEIVAIFGQAMGPQTLAIGAYDNVGNLNIELAGMQVTFNGVPAPLVYGSSTVIAAIAPFEIADASQVDVQVGYDGTLSITETFDVAPTAPGIFTMDASGSGQAAILNQDYTLNSADNPASAGSVVAVYATGGGQTEPPDATGTSAQGAAQLIADVSATVGGQPAVVRYAGHAPSEVAGVMQVNIEIPDGVSGNLPVVVTVGGFSSQATATVAVQ